VETVNVVSLTVMQNVSAPLLAVVINVSFAKVDFAKT
jgi:hypothetical protein